MLLVKIGTFKTFFLKFGENCMRYSGINSFHLSVSQKARDPVNTVAFRVGFVTDKVIGARADTTRLFSASGHSSSTPQSLLLSCARAKIQ